MTCLMESPETAELLLAYCARKLDPQTAAILEQHLAVCPSCGEFQRAQQSVWDALDSWESAPVSEDFDEQLYRRIEARPAARLWLTRLLRPFPDIIAPRLMGKSVPLAAAAGLLVLASIIMQRPESVVVEDPVADVRVESIQPEQVERTLDDMEMLRQFKISAVSDAGNVNSM